jgi:hypothetical protein
MTYSPIQNLIWLNSTVTPADVPTDSILGEEFRQMADDNSEPDEESDMFSSFLYYKDTPEQAQDLAEVIASFGEKAFVYEWPKHSVYAVARGNPARDATRRGMRLISSF